MFDRLFHTIFYLWQYCIFLFSIFISFFIKKDNSLIVICVRKNITENHKALFQYVAEKKCKNVIILYQKLFVKHFSNIPSYKTYSILGWLYFMKTNKLLISHGKFDYKPYIKLPHHKIVNMWHGTPLKKIGDKPTKVVWDYHITSSEFEKNIIMSSFSLDSVQVKVLGVPKNDFLFSLLKKPNKKKQILYLNTYRDFTDSIFFAFENRDLEEINQILKEMDMYIIFKLHPNEFSNTNINELLLFSQFRLADELFDIQIELKKSVALITDYSSVIFDALAINLPIILLPYDLLHYSKIIGFNRNYEEFIPENHVFNQKDFIDRIKIINKNKEIPDLALERERYFKYTDTNSSYRLLNFIKSI